LRVEGWPGQQFALLFVDWLKAKPEVRAEYLRVKQQAAAAVPAVDGVAAYAEAKEPWYLSAYPRAWEWADSTGWRP
jgi:dephospho-CoA kinase